MFDVSFFELLVIGVVALVVIGPERLPGAIKTCALWIGRMKRILAESRTEFEKHIGADEIRRELHNEQIMASLEKLKSSRAILEQDLLNYQNTIQAELHAIEHGEAPKNTPTNSAEDHTAEIEAKPEIDLSDSATGLQPLTPLPSTDHDNTQKPKSEHD